MQHAHGLLLLTAMCSVAIAGFKPLNGTLPEPIQPGWDRRCVEWDRAEPADTCWALVTRLNMTLQHFYDINPQLQGDCVHNLWAGYWYCLDNTVPAGASSEVATTTPQCGSTTFCTASAGTA
jgi:hypothetical protein